jgi:hypothetical protein
VDEILLRGRPYKIYPKGWFNHKKGVQRVDLDIAAKERKVVSQPTRAAPVLATPPPPKRQRTDLDVSPWKKVIHGPRAEGQATPPRPWSSPNAFDVLDQYVEHSHTVTTSSTGSYKAYAPSFKPRTNAPVVSPPAGYVDITSPDGHTAVRKEISLDDLLLEFAALDSHSSAQATSLEVSIAASQSNSSFCLFDAITMGDADKVQRELTLDPINFHFQLGELAEMYPSHLVDLVRLRLVHRWLRGTFGSTAPFDQLYDNVFGHPYSLSDLAIDLETLIDDSDIDLLIGDEHAIGLPESEAVLALGELVLGSAAPIYYAHDAAISGAISGSVFSIPSHGGHRCLSSFTLEQFLMASRAGTPLWSKTTSLLLSAAHALTDSDDVDMQSTSYAQCLSDWLDALQSMELAINPDTGACGVPYAVLRVDPDSASLVLADLRDDVAPLRA